MFVAIALELAFERVNRLINQLWDALTVELESASWCTACVVDRFDKRPGTGELARARAHARRAMIVHQLRSHLIEPQVERAHA